MRIPKLTLNQILQLALVFVIAVNCIQHFTSPVYREYNKLCSIVANQSAEANRIFFDRTFPTFTNYVHALRLSASTNTFDVASTVCSDVSNDKPISVDHKDIRDRAMPSGKGKGLPISFYRYNGVEGFYYEGFDYRVGDMFFGSPIVFVSPTFVKTVDSYFVCTVCDLPVSQTNNQTVIVHYDDREPMGDGVW